MHSKGELIGQEEAEYSHLGIQLDFLDAPGVEHSQPNSVPEQSALHPLPSNFIPSSQTSVPTTIPSPQVVSQSEVAPELSQVHPGST